MAVEPDTPEAIRAWIEDQDEWPVADSYVLESLAPHSYLANREDRLKEYFPNWFWEGEDDVALLSIGTGKGYFERKFWQRFNSIHVIDPSSRTRRSLECFPIRNVSYLAPSIFHASHRFRNVPKYGWIGAATHYLFQEFHGWEYFWKLGMMVSDTIAVDGGVFDRDTPQGQVLTELWGPPREGFEEQRRRQFRFEAFLNVIEGIWDVGVDVETPWINDGRRTLTLHRKLPPIVQEADLGPMETISDDAHKYSVRRTEEGYYKRSPRMWQLLEHDVVGKVMGWPDFVRWQVYDGDRYCGFVTADCGDAIPNDPEASERLFLGLLPWCLPLGLFPADVARENVRLVDETPVLIDVELADLKELLTTTSATWATTNIYKQYDEPSPHIPSVIGLYARGGPKVDASMSRQLRSQTPSYHGKHADP